MPAESASSSTRRDAGISRFLLMAVLAVLALTALAIRYLLLQPERSAHVAAAVSTAAPPPPTAAHGDVDALLAQARRAIAEQRLLAPAGDNAFEWYLSALQRQPGNHVAVEALREVFPFAATAAERSIDHDEPAEAQRQIDLLARADPGNYTLTLLRKRLAARQQSAAQQPAVPVAPPSRAVPASAPAPARPSPPVVATPAVVSHTASTPAHTTPVPVHPAATVAVPGPAAVATLHPPVLVRRIEPYYPQDARRARRQGWVELHFTVAADGSVEHAQVADADPKNLFDHAALSAVERWRFTPATRNGHPVAMPMHERITFRL